MIYIESPSTDPQFNLALEQYVFDEMDRGESYFMLWQNANAVIVGKHQNTFAEINRRYVEEHQVSVVRRLSGGGAVYHDLGNLNYTIIADQNLQSGPFDFASFCRPVVAALQELGVPAEVNGRNDMTVDGKKFSGNAQYFREGRIMHHGTILFDADMEAVAQALDVAQDKMAAKGIKSVRSRVTNIRPYLREDVGIRRFMDLLAEKMFAGAIRRYALSEKDIARTNEIKDARYGRWEWNFGKSAEYAVHKERRFEGIGKLELLLNVEKGVIKGFDVYGDYFGNGDKLDLQLALIGRRLERADIEEALRGVEIGEYFNNLPKEDFVALLLH